MCKTNR